MHAWVASSRLSAGSGMGGVLRRSAGQPRRGQVPGAWAWRMAVTDVRGACPQARQVSCSSVWCRVQAKVQDSRQRSSHRPSRSDRHCGQYREPLPRAQQTERVTARRFGLRSSCRICPS